MATILILAKMMFGQIFTWDPLCFEVASLNIATVGPLQPGSFFKGYFTDVPTQCTEP